MRLPSGSRVPPAFRRAISMASEWHPRSSATKASVRTRPSSPRHSIAGPKSISRQWGWVPVDPADVRKVALEEPPGNLPLADAGKVDAARHTLFGAWEDELDRLQMSVTTSRCRVRRRGPRPVPDVSARRGRRPPARLPRSRGVPLPHRSARDLYLNVGLPSRGGLAHVCGKDSTNVIQLTLRLWTV